MRGQLTPIGSEYFSTTALIGELVDSHCHLATAIYDEDRLQVLAHAKQQRIMRMLVIGAGEGIAGNQRAQQLCQQHAQLSYAMGIHPHEANLWDETVAQNLQQLLQSRFKPVAIGETGLDYHYNLSEPVKQRRAFEAQLALAQQAQLPIIVHTRQAHADTVAILQNFKTTVQQHGGIIHCFSEDVAAAEAYLQLGMHLSFSGIVTFPKAAAVQAAAKITPRDRLLIETDAPYLSPAPHRGLRCEPACVRWVAEKVAQLRQESLAELARQTSRNACRLFKWPELTQP